MSLSFRDQLSSAIQKLPTYKVIIYVDGFNLYFGIREEAIKRGSREAPNPRWYRYMWLDIQAVGTRMLTSRQELVAIKYFTAPIIGRKGKQERQNTFLDALRTLPLVEIIFGRFEPDRKECDRCGHPAYHPQEKKTDVNIATNLICDAYENRYDTAIIITGDSDLVPALQAAKKIRPDKRFIVAFPPNRYSKEMADATGMEPIWIWEPMLKKSLFPEIIKRENLPDIVRHHKYSGTPGCTEAAKPPEKPK